MQRQGPRLLPSGPPLTGGVHADRGAGARLLRRVLQQDVHVGAPLLHRQGGVAGADAAVGLRGKGGGAGRQ